MSAVNCCQLLSTAQLQQSQGATFVKLPSLGRLGHGRSATITLSHDVPTLAEHVKTIRLYQQNLLHIRHEWAISGMLCGRSQFLKNARKRASTASGHGRTEQL